MKTLTCDLRIAKQHYGPGNGLGLILTREPIMKGCYPRTEDIIRGMLSSEPTMPTAMITDVYVEPASGLYSPDPLNSVPVMWINLTDAEEHDENTLSFRSDQIVSIDENLIETIIFTDGSVCYGMDPLPSDPIEGICTVVNPFWKSYIQRLTHTAADPNNPIFVTVFGYEF